MTAICLEHEALESFRRGEPWAAFWAAHRSDLAEAQPATIQRLLAIEASGDDANCEPIGNPEPLVDARPADVGTRARFQWLVHSGV